MVDNKDIRTSLQDGDWYVLKELIIESNKYDLQILNNASKMINCNSIMGEPNEILNSLSDMINSKYKG